MKASRNSRQRNVWNIGIWYKLIDVLSGKRVSADTVLNVATVEFRFGAVVLIEKLVFTAAYEMRISVAGSHFGTHDRAIDLFVREWKTI